MGAWLVGDGTWSKSQLRSRARILVNAVANARGAGRISSQTRPTDDQAALYSNIHCPGATAPAAGSSLATSVLIAFALIALSLFLPPINLPDRLIAAQYSPLTAASPAIARDPEFRLSLPPDELADDFAVKIERLPSGRIQIRGRRRRVLAGRGAREDLPTFSSLQQPAICDRIARPPASESTAIELECRRARSPSPERLSLYGWNGSAGVSSHPSLPLAPCRARLTLPRAPSPPSRSARRRRSS